MTTWITHAQAAEILGVGQSAIPKMVARGALKPRPKLGSRPTLSRAKVEALRDRRADAARAQAARRAVEPAPQPQPPDTEHIWLTVTEAAALIGITKQAMNRRCLADKMPSTMHDGRRWIRRDQLAMIEKAHAVRDGVDTPEWI